MSRERIEHPPANSGHGGLAGELVAIYRGSLKPRDIAWNLVVARPLAAVALLVLRRLPVTPNQVTFMGLLVFLAVPALLATVPGAVGFAAAVLALEASYVLDCADGQLARLEGMTSEVGAYLDFLVDEVKALLLVGGAATALWRHDGDAVWLLVGMVGVGMVAVATALTTFVRRPEYAGIEIKPGVEVTGPSRPPLRRPLHLAFWGVQRVARLVVHYPSWLPLLAIVALVVPALDPLRVFLCAYLGVYALYIGHTALAVGVRLGRPGFYRR